MSLLTWSTWHFYQRAKKGKKDKEWKDGFQSCFTFLEVKKKLRHPKDCIKLASAKCWWAWWEASERSILTAWGRQFFWTGGHWLSTHLTETVPSIKGNPIARWEWTPGKLKRKMYFSKGHARNFPLFPVPWVCCLPPLQSVFYRTSSHIVLQSGLGKARHWKKSSPRTQAEQRLDSPCILV